MKIILMSDIHGKHAFLDSMGPVLQGADMIVLAGDISHAGARRGAEEILERIEKVNRNIIAVHGNWDGEDIQDLLQERGYSVHGMGKQSGSTGFFGLGGSNSTPMHTPCEYSDEQIHDFLEQGYRYVDTARVKVLVSHTPPRKTRDRTFLGLRGGSQVIRDFILDHDIRLCLCGHIHEARGTAELGDCLVVNSGAFKSGRYMLIDLTDTVNVTEGRAVK